MQIKKEGNKLKLIIEDARMFDSGEYTVKSGDLMSTAEAQVAEGLYN